MKKIYILAISITLSLLCMFTLTSCTNYKEAKKESKQKVKRYKQDLIQGVKDAYGDDIEVKNIESSLDIKMGEVVPEPYFVTGSVHGTFELAGKKYYVYYDEHDNTIKDNVHSSEIKESMMEELPFDKSKYLQYDCTGNIEYLPPDIDSLEKFMDYNYATFNIYIVTTEDLYAYKDYDVESISTFKKLKDSNESGSIIMKVVCIKDNSKSGSLLNNLKRSLWFSGIKHPTVSVGNETYDAFDYYGIQNALDISYPGTHMDGTHVAYMD